MLVSDPETFVWHRLSVAVKSQWDPCDCYNVGALIIRIGFCGPLYYNYHKESFLVLVVIFKFRPLYYYTGFGRCHMVWAHRFADLRDNAS